MEGGKEARQQKVFEVEGLTKNEGENQMAGKADKCDQRIHESPKGG